VTAGRTPADEQYDRLAVRLGRLVPGLDVTTARQVLAAAKVTGVVARRLDAHLSAHPDALASGDNTCPLAVVRLIHALLAVGFPGVVAPACARCATLSPRLSGLSPDGRICTRCAYETRPHHTCVQCGHRAPAQAVTDDGPVCKDCYRVPRRECGACGRLRPVGRRGAGDAPDLCHGCYLRTRPPVVCAHCGRPGRCQSDQDGRPRCQQCRSAPRRDCVRCGRNRRVQALWPDGPVCPACYARARAHPAPCSRCHQTTVLITDDPRGGGLCSACTGIPAPQCPSCGQPGMPHAHGPCARCVALTRLRQRLAGPDGQPNSQLQPVLDALTSLALPAAIVGWLRTSAADQLSTLARTGTAITHELLDTLPVGHTERYLRHLLVAAGVLPHRDDDLERITAWLEQQLHDRPAHHAVLIRPFAHWQILRRARTHRRKPGGGAGAAGFARARILIALDFVGWLDQHDRTLATLTQADLDTWLTTGTTNRYHLRTFIVWANRRRLTHHLTVPHRRRGDPATFLDDEHRWQLLHRCLTDTAMPSPTRIAGALVLLFGIRLSRITALRSTDITRRGADTYLTLGAEPTLLPASLAALIHEHVHTLRPATPVIASLTHDPWLFPGRVPGRHAESTHYGERLRRYRIPTRAAHNSALISLAADLPPAVLAHLLDININTATGWAKYAKRDWTDYLAARDQDGRNTAHEE
jgi:hypothetical protein